MNCKLNEEEEFAQKMYQFMILQVSHYPAYED